VKGCLQFAAFILLCFLAASLIVHHGFQ